jgi:hypothetical protein
VGTIGVLPGLITGRGLVESCRTSIDVVRKKFKEVVKLRLGYSFFCWIVGTSAYIGTILFFVYIHDPDPNHEGAAATIYSFYLWAGVPICIAVGVIQIFLRPIYMIAACHIYSDYLNENKKKIILPVPPSKGMSALVAFCALLFIVAIVFLYRDQLGITELLSTVYQ